MSLSRFMVIWQVRLGWNNTPAHRRRLAQAIMLFRSGARKSWAGTNFPLHGDTRRSENSFSADGGRRDDFLCKCGTATNVWFDGLRGSLHTGVQMQLSTGRQSPRTATSRGRPPQRRNDHDPPAHRGRAASGQASCSVTTQTHET